MFTVTKLIIFLIPQMISLLGSSALQMGIIWHLTLSYSSGTILMAASIAAYIPQIIFSIIAGHIIDKRHRKLLIMLSDMVSASLALILYSVISVGHDSLYLYFLVMAGRSAAAGFQTPAVESAIPFFVPIPLLEKANAIRSALSSVVMFASPVLAGILMSSSGLKAVIILDILTALVAVVVVLFLHVPENEEGNSYSFVSGVRYVLSDSRITRPLFFHLLAMLAIGPGAVLTPLIVERLFSGNPAALSLSEASYSLGMIAGGAAAALFSCSLSRTKKIGISLSVYGLMLFLMPISRFFILYLVMNLCIGLISPVYSSLFISEIQERADKSRIGQTMGIYGAVSGVFPLSLIVYGPLSDLLGIEEVFIISGAITIFIGIVLTRRLLQR